MSFCKLQELVMDREAWHAAIHGLQSWMWLSDWTELMWRANSWRPWCFKDWRREEKGRTEDEMVGWHHWFNGHEFEQAPADGERQGSLVCCSPWGHKELDLTEKQQPLQVNRLSLWVASVPTPLINLQFPTQQVSSHLHFLFTLQPLMSFISTCLHFKVHL